MKIRSGDAQNAVNLVDYTPVLTVVLKDHSVICNLKILVARMKILPNGPGINASKFEPLIIDILPDGAKIRQITEEPIEFEDKPGALDVVEECVNKLEQVSELETIAVSNTSTGVGE